MKLKSIECKDLGKEVAIQTATGLYFLSKENIKIIARYKKERTLCWYYHPIFKKLTHVQYRIKDGRPEFYLPKEELVDLEALRSFVSTDEFKARRYAFMNYQLLEKLSA
jgi:hypothetical protein